MLHLQLGNCSRRARDDRRCTFPGFLSAPHEASTDKQRHRGLDALGYKYSANCEWPTSLGSGLVTHGRGFYHYFW